MALTRESPVAVVRFTRGTIECVGLPADLPLPPASQLVFDARTGTHRGRAMDRAAIVQFVTDAGYRVRGDEPQTVDSREMDSVEIQDVSLRDYQSTALQAWRLGDRRGVVVLPTGAGKTRVAIAAIAAERTRALIVVPTRVLLRRRYHRPQRGR